MSPHEARQRANWGIGIALGMGVGVAMGAALQNMGVGIALGIAIGVAFALAFGRTATAGGSGADVMGDGVAEDTADAPGGDEVPDDDDDRPTPGY